MITRRIEKKMAELGRIRLGDREPNSSGKGTHPHKLDVFRLTSPNSPLLHFAASTYGGTVQPWVSENAPKDEHGRPTQFELYTTVNALDVLVPTMSAVSLTFEQWGLSGCQRRCTGERITHCPGEETLIDQPCTCPEDDLERADLAKTGKACARILRLNVLLPDLPGMGVWRLETKGFYATAELLGTLDMLQMVGQEHSIIEAVLRLEQRTVKRPGKGEGKGTLKFAVPVLWPKYTPRQILASAANVLLALPPLPVPPPSLPATIAELCGEDTASDTLVERITTLLQAQGLSDTQIADWWAKMDTKYAGRTPLTLSLLYEQLQARAAQMASASAPAIGPESPDLFAAEEAAEYGE